MIVTMNQSFNKEYLESYLFESNQDRFKTVFLVYIYLFLRITKLYNYIKISTYWVITVLI
jgi:hypothetical protein